MRITFKIPGMWNMSIHTPRQIYGAPPEKLGPGRLD